MPALLVKNNRGFKRSISDHVPILLSPKDVDWGPRPFKVLNYWFSSSDCMRKLKEVYQNAPWHGDVGYSLLVKLKTKKAFLKRWNREEFGNIDTKMENPEKLVDELDTLGIARELNVTELDLKRRFQAELWKALL
ncbi:hypothetical protein ES288_A10G163000v1 [Gossypium darwinii]|uniref:Uncharacterized protein n=1 Tax=Gossypium darwinii TaxID=34276 RepID=A0A5D2EZ01_GOSDA|nr:hypothetical protein ES288_A10G163000v1 [Gossypium darwinii]